MIGEARAVPSLHHLALRTVLLGTLALLAGGCNSTAREQAPQLAVVPVQGQVFVNRQPAVRASVIFHPLNDPEGKVPRSTAFVDSDGKFTLSTYSAGDGAPPGEYAVTILWPEGDSPIGGDAESGPDRLGNRYSDPRTTPLRAKVDDGATDLKPFQLQR